MALKALLCSSNDESQQHWSASMRVFCHNLPFWKHKKHINIPFPPKNPEKYSTPSTGTKNEKHTHSFAHTFCAKIMKKSTRTYLRLTFWLKGWSIGKILLRARHQNSVRRAGHTLGIPCSLVSCLQVQCTHQNHFFQTCNSFY
jgi:hypothetical protein